MQRCVSMHCNPMLPSALCFLYCIAVYTEPWLQEKLKINHSFPVVSRFSRCVDFVSCQEVQLTVRPVSHIANRSSCVAYHSSRELFLDTVLGRRYSKQGCQRSVAYTMLISLALIKYTFTKEKPKQVSNCYILKLDISFLCLWNICWTDCGLPLSYHIKLVKALFMFLAVLSVDKLPFISTGNSNIHYTALQKSEDAEKNVIS